MEDNEKILVKRRELNGGENGPWIAVDGTNALIKVQGDFRTNTNVVFMPASGIPVKVFMNTINGEIRMFPAILFERDA
jgi:hypothetical protein